MPGTKRIDVTTVGLSMSERLLIGAFLDLIALTDGHIFRLCDYINAPIVVVNPAETDAAALLKNPQAGIAYIQYGMPEIGYGPDVWRLASPLRLGELREILVGVVKKRHEWRLSGALAPSDPLMPAADVGMSRLALLPSGTAGQATQQTTATSNLPVPAHRKLEQVLGVLEGIMQTRIAHAMTGIAEVEILIFPLENAVFIQCGSGNWQKALHGITRPVAAFSRVGARPSGPVPPITIEQLRWELARHLSCGLLLPGIAGFQEFTLKRWPDFGKMSVGSGYDLRVVALIAARPSSIAQMLKVVPYTREGIIALLNGCALIGCMLDAPVDLLAPAGQARLSVAPSPLAAPEAAKAPAPTPTPPQRGFVGMLSKLRAALSFTPRVNS